MSRRRILLAVTGLSPQVVTETLYALAVAAPDPWIPDEIQLITTLQGKERARLALLSDRPGWFARLCADYDLPPIRFDETGVHVVPGAGGVSLDDIRTPRDNECAADFITETVRGLTSDPATELHVSIAGGRKTMGYYLGYALSLFGRPQDRLSHVLVNEPFESSWNFFYPTPYSQVIETRDKALADTRDARVSLAEIPFVSLRDGLPTRLLEGGATLSETVAVARKALEPPRLRIDRHNRRILAGDESVDMAPADLAFYTLMAANRLVGGTPINHRDEDLAARYLEEYGRIVGVHSGDYERVEERLRDSPDLKEWFDQRKSKTNKALKKALGERLGGPYLVLPTGRRPHTRYELQLPAEAITFADGKLAGSALAAENRDTSDRPENRSR